MILHPVHITNPDWQAYNTLCLKLFSEGPIRRLDARGLKMSPSTFLSTMLPWTHDESISQSVVTGTAKHIFLGFLVTEYNDGDILMISQCADIACRELDPGLMMISGSLKSWYDATLCLAAAKSDAAVTIYTHLKRAGFDALFRGYELVDNKLKVKR